MVDQVITLSAAGRGLAFTMRLDPAIQPDIHMLEHFKQGKCYEPELAWVMFRALQTGDIAIDVGANIGFFTGIMSKLVGLTGRVIACEPGGNNHRSLKHTILANNLDNVAIEQRPIWCRDEEVTFYINSDSRASNALFDPGNWPTNGKSRSNPQPTKVQAVTLDTLVADLDARLVKVIKIDTEGAEQKVLEGASNLLSMFHPPYIMAELNPHGLYQAGDNAESLREYMRQFGYDLFFIHGDDKLPSLVPPATRIKYVNDIVVSNILFSTLDDVGKIWPESIANG